MLPQKPPLSNTCVINLKTALKFVLRVLSPVPRIAKLQQERIANDDEQRLGSSNCIIESLSVISYKMHLEYFGLPWVTLDL